jgi:hypothetical protein
MHLRFGDDLDTSQEDALDPATFIAEFDAIVRAPHKPMSAERQIAGIGQALGRLIGIVPAPVVMLAPSLLEEFEAWVTAFDAGTLDLKPPAPAPPPVKSELPAIVARIAGIMAGTPTPANDDRPTEDEPEDKDESTPAIVSPTGEPLEKPAPALAPLKFDLVTKSGSARRRKSPLRDRQDAASKRNCRRSTQAPAEGNAKAPISKHSLPPLTPHQNDNQKQQSKEKTQEKAKRRTKSRARYVATWIEAGDLTRIGYVNDSLAIQGRRFAFTVDLSPDMIKAANDNPRGPLDFYWRKLSREWAKRLPDHELAGWLVLETTQDGRQHLHGGIAVDHNGTMIPAAREALTATGGDWVGRDAYLKPQQHPIAWARYPLKRQARTRQHVRKVLGLDPEAPVRIACWSKSLVKDAKRLLEIERRAIGRR